MQSRTKLFLSAVLLIIMILSMVTPAFATETEPATESTTEHIHTWQTSSAGKAGHYMICTTCDETQSGSHTFNSEDICTVCGRYFHTHKWQRIKADSQFHTVVCTKCDETQTVTHSMSGGVCSVCGYEAHTHTMQYVGGAVYDSQHETKCTSCDTIGSEDHTYGSDDKCTVCGAERPCEHQWTCNGEQIYNQHVLICACGQTMHEPHSWTWDAAGQCAVCTACGLKDSGHWHKYVYPNGTCCLECGYIKGTEESATQPNGTEPDETAPTETEPADTKPAETAPAETEPVDTEPTETEPAETGPADTEPAETGSAETEPVETEPTETNPAEVSSGEANPAEAEPEASGTIDEEDEEVDSQSDGSTLVWVVAVVSIVTGLTAGLFLWKKKSS